MELRKPLLCLFLGIALFFAFTERGHWPPNLIDYYVYDDAGVKALNHQTVYDVDGHFQFKYSPFAALALGGVFKWLGHEPMAAWGLFLLGWIALIWLWAGKSATGRLEGFALFAGLFLLPWRDEVKMGQINFIPLLLLYFVFRTSRKGLRGALVDGATIALAAQFKLYAVIALALWAFRRQWSALVIFALFFILWNLIGVGLYSGIGFAWSETLAWLHTLTASSAHLLTYYLNVSILGTVGKWFGPSLGLHWIAWTVGLGLWGRVLWKIRGADLTEQMAWTLCGVILLNPLVWQYWIVMLYPMALGVFNVWRASGGWRPHSRIQKCVLFLLLAWTCNSWVGHYGGILIATCLLAFEYSRVVLVRR